MQLNVKHYIAIGLGIGLAAAYCLHLGSDQKKTDGFGQIGQGLNVLSSFEDPDQNIPTPDLVNSANVAKLQQNSILESSANQGSFENDFAPPELASDFDDSLTLLPAMLNDESLPESNSVAEPANDMNQPDNLEISQELLVASQAVTESSPALPVNAKNAHVRQSERHRYGWKKNPFVGAGSNVRATHNSPPTVRSQHDNSSQTGESLQNESDNRLVQVESMSREDSDSNLTAKQESSVLMFGGDDSESTPGSDADNSFVVQPSSLVQQVEVNPTPFLARQQDGLVRQKVAEAAITPLRTELSPTAAQQAAQHIEYGKTLSRRGAVFAARQEFILALSIIAQSKDETAGGTEFSRALTRGLLALKETNGFVPDNIEAGTTLDIALVVETHRSNVITGDEAEILSPAQATQRYFEFALERLDHACGRNVVSAEAFFCLGKLFTAMSKTQSVPTNLDTSKAIVFHKAALQSDDKNYRSSNELGVLMAQTGRLQEATEYFKQSLIVNRTPQAWMNLAKTHRRLGETEFAELAESEYVLASQAPLVNANNSTAAIQWMPTQKFNAMAPVQSPAHVASKPTNLQKKSTGQDKLKKLSKSFSKRLKELF